jgi:hypothetical protein
MSNSKKKPEAKKSTKKASPKKATAKKPTDKKATAKKTSAKKPASKKPAETKSPKPRTVKTTPDTSTTLIDAVVEAVITTPEVKVVIAHVEDEIEKVGSLIRMNDVKTASIRKKMIAWFRKR